MKNSCYSRFDVFRVVENQVKVFCVVKEAVRSSNTLVSYGILLQHYTS